MKKVFLNNGLVDEKDACVPASDSGFLYGMGLFETMRALNGRVFGFDDHFERLSRSAVSLSINNPYSKEYIRNAIDKLLAENTLTDARLRLTLTAGTVGDEQPGSTLLITAAALAGYPSEYYSKGVRVTLTDYRQNPADPLSGHKVTSYAARILALNQAHVKGAAEALWFTSDNKLAEGCISNVFLVKDKVLYTPRLDTPVLPGVARKHALALAGENNIEAVEKDLAINDLLEADEIFLTNVIMLVLPVVAVEAHTVGNGKVGPVTKKLTEKLHEHLERFCSSRKGG